MYTIKDLDFEHQTYGTIKGGQTFLNKKAEISSQFETQLVSKMTHEQKTEYKQLQAKIYSKSKNKKYKYNCSEEKCKKYKFSDNRLTGNVKCTNHEERHLLYLDVNALYSYAMCQYLPCSDYEILSSAECNDMESKFKTLSFEQLNVAFPDQSSTGYLFFVDISVPSSIHDMINEFSPIFAKQDIDFNDLSPHSQKTYATIHQSNFLRSERSISSLSDQYNYHVHYSNLKFLIKLGVKVNKVNSCYSFTQSPWLSQYVKNCIKLRQKADNEFEKSLFKLFSNSIYGKFIENVYNHTDSYFVKDSTEYYDLVNQKIEKDFIIHAPNFLQVLCTPQNINVSKPRIISSTILELAKLHMYKFWYETIRTSFTSCNICYSDTDSLILCFKDVSLSEIYQKLRNHLDISNFKIKPFKSNISAGSIGFWKSETADLSINMFLGLRKKSYYIVTDSTEKLTLKGIIKTAFQDINAKDFINHILYTSSKNVSFYRITSKKHELSLTHEEKLALSSFDCSNFYLNCNICSRRFGHYKNTTDNCNDPECKKIKLLLSVYLTL